MKAVLTRPQGLSEMYSEVLRFIPKHCSLLLEITQHKADQGVSGFDFVVNAVWPEVVSLIDAKASVVFAPGNPDSFHKVDTTCLLYHIKGALARVLRTRTGREIIVFIMC